MKKKNDHRSKFSNCNLADSNPEAPTNYSVNKFIRDDWSLSNMNNKQGSGHVLIKLNLSCDRVQHVLLILWEVFSASNQTKWSYKYFKVSFNGGDQNSQTGRVELCSKCSENLEHKLTRCSAEQVKNCFILAVYWARKQLPTKNMDLPHSKQLKLNSPYHKEV